MASSFLSVLVAALVTVTPGLQLVDDGGARTPDDPAATAKAVLTQVRAAAADGVTEQVVVVDRATGDRIVGAGADTPVPAMSLVKLFIATDAIYSAGGVGGLTATERRQLRTMIATSDDVIASDWYAALGEDAVVWRTVQRYGLTGTSTAPDPRYWGDIRTTAADVATVLTRALRSSVTGAWLADAMSASTDVAADGFDQDFGVAALPDAGVKQGWGCCLGGVVALHSAGFTDDRVIVVLSPSYPDTWSSLLQSAGQLEADPGAQAALRRLTATAKAAA